MVYGDFNDCGQRKNKANQSQFAGEAELARAIPKAFVFEAATQSKFEKTKLNIDNLRL